MGWCRLGWGGGATREREREGGKEEERGRRKRKSGGGFETLPEMAQCFSVCPTLVLYFHSGTGTRGPVLYMNSRNCWSVFYRDTLPFFSIAQYIPTVIQTPELGYIYRTPGPQNNCPLIHLKRTKPQKTQPKTVS